MGIPNLEATFETLVDAFVFSDKNKDGFVSKNEMVQAINESGEGLSGRIAMKRFGQLSLSLSLYIYIYIYIYTLYQKMRTQTQIHMFICAFWCIHA